MTDQLFIISKDLMNAISQEEAEATYNDMVELDIAKLPFAECDVQFHQIMEIYGNRTDLDSELPQWAMGYSKVQNEKPTLVETVEFWVHLSQSGRSYVKNMRGRLQDDFMREMIQSYNDPAMDRDKSGHAVWDRAKKLLIVLLATRNIIKETKVSKLAKLGIGKRKGMRFPYTTTLKIGNVTETVFEGTGEGTVRPHLRRGHIRRQKYGPGLEFTKKIFIQPCFVNADPTFINSRRAYNVSGG